MPFDEQSIQIIDLFAGPGGLGEGFSTFKYENNRKFQLICSIEKDYFAHQTLELRAFFRSFEAPPKEYYEYVRGEITKEELYCKFPLNYEAAKAEALNFELGSSDEKHSDLVSYLHEKIDLKRLLIIVGGPPCQAYSLAGRSSMANNPNKVFDEDPRHTLYREYLKFLTDFRPAVFILENVKGMLSSKLNGERIFPKIVEDLTAPFKALKIEGDTIYKIYSLVKPDGITKESDFIIKSEEYGVPQSRHRVILVGVRSDIKRVPESLVVSSSPVTVEEAIKDLPKIRSGLSKQEDNYTAWSSAIKERFPNAELAHIVSKGANFISHKELLQNDSPLSNWYLDEKLHGTLNHESKSHIKADLHRYHFMAKFAAQEGYSPKLNIFPEDLLPKHKNVQESIRTNSLFNDRFKVQLASKPATTITSHIAKDGHYFVHYDPEQTRSLTVREAARLQTFPDNYKFEGPRTSQYQQVGNAVPPFLAFQIAKIVYTLLAN